MGAGARTATKHTQQPCGNVQPELWDLTIYGIDVAGGEKIPRKGGPGMTKSDLLVINKKGLLIVGE